MIEALAFLALAGLLPGLALAVLLRLLRPASADVGLVVAVLGWTLVCWLVTAGVVMQTVGLDATALWSAGAITAVPSVVLLALPRSWRVLKREGRETLWTLGALGLGVLAWLPVGLLAWRTPWAPIGGTSWYYWGLAQQTAAAGRLPETSVEFGTTVPFLSDYPLFTSGTAALISVAPQGGADLVRLVVTTVPVLLAAVGSSVLARALGVGRLAALVAAPLAVGTGVAANKLTAYRPEGFAIGCLLLAVALVAVGLRHRDVGFLAVGVAATAVLSQVHGIAMLFGTILLVAVGIVLWLRDRTRRTARDVVTVGVAAVASAGLLAVLLGSLSGWTHGGGISDVGGLSDPTWDFSRAARGWGPSPPPDPARLLVNGLRGIYDTQDWWYAGLAAVCLLLVLATRALRRRLGAVAGFVVVSLLGLALPVAVFLLGWDSYVPRRTGTSRIIAETSVLLPVLVAGGVEAARLLLAAWTRRPAVGAGFAAVLVVLSVVAGVLGSGWVVEKNRDYLIAKEDLEALRDLDVPDDAVVLTDGYSEGVIHATTGATGLLEGRAPFTFPDVLARANMLLREAKEFYRRPRAGADFLDANSVDYVVVQNAPVLTSIYRFRTPQALELMRMGVAFEEVLTRPKYSVFRYTPKEPADPVADVP